ncbi:MAG: septum formation initiator family protein [Bdellovibrionales bacterium]
MGQLFWSLIGASLVGYFLYHTVQGDRGWFAMLRVQNEIKIGEANLARLTKEREELEHRTTLLRDKSMDPDLLDEKARELLNYSKPNEIIILTPQDKSPDLPKSP